MHVQRVWVVNENTIRYYDLYSSVIFDEICFMVQTDLKFNSLLNSKEL